METIKYSEYYHNPTIKTIAVICPILWYFYLGLSRLLNRKQNKRNKEIESNNLELDNQIKKTILKNIQNGDPSKILEELEERQRYMLNNKTND